MEVKLTQKLCGVAISKSYEIRKDTPTFAKEAGML